MKTAENVANACKSDIDNWLNTRENNVLLKYNVTLHLFQFWHLFSETHLSSISPHCPPLSLPLSLCLSISLSLSVSQDRELRALRAAMNDSSSPLCVIGLAKVFVKRRENPDRGVTDTQVWG